MLEDIVEDMTMEEIRDHDEEQDGGHNGVNMMETRWGYTGKQNGGHDVGQDG